MVSMITIGNNKITLVPRDRIELSTPGFSVLGEHKLKHLKKLINELICCI